MTHIVHKLRISTAIAMLAIVPTLLVLGAWGWGIAVQTARMSDQWLTCSC